MPSDIKLFTFSDCSIWFLILPLSIDAGGILCKLVVEKAQEGEGAKKKQKGEHGNLKDNMVMFYPVFR